LIYLKKKKILYGAANKRKEGKTRGRFTERLSSLLKIWISPYRAQILGPYF